MRGRWRRRAGCRACEAVSPLTVGRRAVAVTGGRATVRCRDVRDGHFFFFFPSFFAFSSSVVGRSSSSSVVRRRCASLACWSFLSRSVRCGGRRLSTSLSSLTFAVFFPSCACQQRRLACVVVVLNLPA